ncbi:methionyl-tRNA formyltransferase [Erythrobacter sp. EhN03]|uniref:formyltransferase family protein n=1 Tax=Qipengyuania flava TaxID=192812 RepID=UPI0007F42714|nr:methionyl-tRNA formyltransferase [Erythrobacter sp. EhN03]
MKFGFVTCVQLGLSCMEAIYRAGGGLELIVTLDDDLAREKSGRIYVDDFAEKHDVPVAKVRNINHNEAIASLRNAELDWLFIIGWSQIARQEVLNIPSRGVIGMHPTLLPVGRGRAAIPWTILKGLKKTGVTMFKMDSGVDTGPILAQLEIPVPSSCNATTLYRLVDDAHIALIEATFADLSRGKVEARLQDDRRATEWPGRKPEDGEIDLEGSVCDAERLIRATSRPYPGAFVFENRRKLIIWEAQMIEPETITSRPVLTFKDGLLECLDFEYVGSATSA